MTQDRSVVIATKPDNDSSNDWLTLRVIFHEFQEYKGILTLLHVWNRV
jgi:hypothetical protein